jgi:hypothetical protein
LTLNFFIPFEELQYWQTFGIYMEGLFAVYYENFIERQPWKMEQNKKKHLASLFDLEKLRETADVIKR